MIAILRTFPIRRRNQSDKTSLCFIASSTRQLQLHDILDRKDIAFADEMHFLVIAVLR